jgi:hypothetical protein
MAREREQPRTLRLFVAYSGTDLRLLDRQSVEMIPPPADDVEERRSGFWLELRDGKGQTVYSQVTQNPIRLSAELLTDDRERPIARAELAEVKGEFVLHVPDLPEAKALVFMSSPAGPAGLGEPASEVARLDLTQRPGQEPASA